MSFGMPGPSTSERPSNCAFNQMVYPSTPTSHGFLLRMAGIPALKEKGKLATRERPHRDLEGSAGGPTLDRTTSELY